MAAAVAKIHLRANAATCRQARAQFTVIDLEQELSLRRYAAYRVASEMHMTERSLTTNCILDTIQTSHKRSTITLRKLS